jgi:hypothetical protein
VFNKENKITVNKRLNKIKERLAKVRYQLIFLNLSNYEWIINDMFA